MNTSNSTADFNKWRLRLASDILNNQRKLDYRSAVLVCIADRELWGSFYSYWLENEPSTEVVEDLIELMNDAVSALEKTLNQGVFESESQGDHVKAMVTNTRMRRDMFRLLISGLPPESINERIELIYQSEVSHSISDGVTTR